ISNVEIVAITHEGSFLSIRALVLSENLDWGTGHHLTTETITPTVKATTSANTTHAKNISVTHQPDMMRQTAPVYAVRGGHGRQGHRARLRLLRLGARANLQPRDRQSGAVGPAWRYPVRPAWCLGDHKRRPE